MLRFGFRFLDFHALFYAERGYCKNCQKPLSGRYRTFCKDCQGAYFEFQWASVATEVIDRSPICSRCGRPQDKRGWGDSLEACHIESIEEIQVRLSYRPMSKWEFEKAHFPPDWEENAKVEWTPEIVMKWRKQIELNRLYMKTVLDPKNLVVKCRGCHDYEHARKDLLERMARVETGSVKWKLLEAQLTVLDERNDVTLISKKGYDKTHKDSWKDLREKLTEEERIAQIRANNRVLTEFG